MPESMTESITESIPTIILGLFETPLEAQLAMQALVTAGLGENDISIILPGDEAHVGAPVAAVASVAAEATKPSTRLTAGLGAGAAAGGALGLLAGLGAFAIPGLGPILAAGPVVAALEGVGFGAIAGGFSGTLSEVGIPESKLEYYGESVRSGAVLVLAHSRIGESAKIHKVMEGAGAMETAERREVDLDRTESPTQSAHVISML